MKKSICMILVVAILNTFILSSAVYADFSKTQATEIYKATKIEELTSKAYAIGNADANQVVQTSSTADDKIRVGNVTKLMTLYLTYEAIESGILTADTQLEVSVAAQEVLRVNETVLSPVSLHKVGTLM